MTQSKKPLKAECGVIVPIVTPLANEGKLDETALRRLVDHLIAGGVQGIFVLGSTGEGPSVTRSMRPRVVQVAVEQTAGRARVYAGINDTSLADSIAAAAEYRRLGVDVMVASLPSYYTITPDEQFLFLSSLAEAVAGPMLLYDIPKATHNPLDMRAIEHLRVFSNVVGIKDSSGEYNRLDALLSAYSGDEGFSVLVGSTPLAAYGLKHGADGFVPSSGNLEPALCARLYAASATGDWALMDGLQSQLDELTGLYAQSGTIAGEIEQLKKLLSERGLCGKKVFPPLKEAE